MKRRVLVGESAFFFVPIGNFVSLGKFVPFGKTTPLPERRAECIIAQEETTPPASGQLPE